MQRVAKIQLLPLLPRLRGGWCANHASLEKDTMKLRYGMPKYQRTWSGLFILGLGMVWLARYLGAAASGAVSTLGFVIVAAGMSVLVAGMIAERRNWERHHEKSD